MNPKISFVVTARNDDYGGNLLNRIETSIKVLSHLVNKYHIQSELIVVEYNPTPNKPLLYEALTLPKSNFLNYRFIQVPLSFHEKQPGSDKTPMLEFLAKNIGIRRTKGKYIIAMNPDIIFSKELIHWLVKTELSLNTFYRINRHDTTVDYFDPKLTAKQIIDRANRHVFRIWMNDKTQYHSWLAWGKRLLIGRNKKNFIMCPIFNKKTDGTKKEIIHERAAGDFLLMHKTIWDKVHGYDDKPITGFVDGYILYVLYCLNLKQKIIPYPIYHINHKIGYAGRPVLAVEKYRKDIEKMKKTKIPYKKYSPDWGFPNEDFKEIIITN